LRTLTLSVVVAVASLTACRFDVDYGQTSYACPGQGRCPPGYVCVAEVCVAEGADADAGDGGDAPSADAAPDASGDAGVCERAALRPSSNTCAMVAQNDLSAAAREPGGITVHGDTTDYSNDLMVPNTTCTLTTTAGPDAVYRIDAVAGETLTATLTPEGWDSVLFIAAPSCSGASCVTGVDSAEPEVLTYQFGADGLHYLVVTGKITADAGCYTLHVELTEP
jgi:hypothetical protein